MFGNWKRWPVAVSVLVLILCGLGSGCLGLRSSRGPGPGDGEPGGPIPTELAKVSLPEYTIAPPDILVLDAVSLVPRPPYLIKPLDVLAIKVTVAGVAKEKEDPLERRSLVPGQPIDGLFRVESDGTVNLGFDYGQVKVSGGTVQEARKTVTKHLKERFKVEFDVSVTLAESRALQQIRGEHLVRPDGKITLGTYGSVYVTGMTLEEAKTAIELHLSRTLLKPEISVDVSGYNSKVYYVIYDLYGAGQQVYRLPATGNETVLDAVAELRGLSPGSDHKRMWISRPSPANNGCNQILPVDWDAITKGGVTATNYQLLPGDRVFVSFDRFYTADTFLAKVLAPVERVLGITLLGTSVVQQIQQVSRGTTTTTTTTTGR